LPVEVNQTITVARPPEDVWKFLSDVPAVADCVPGLELHDQREDGTYLATFAIKVGPLSAKLEGEGLLTRDDEDLSASLEGKGVDKRGGSRAKGTMRYQVVGSAEGSVIEVAADFRLSGPLAQVGRTSIIDDVARSLTRQFAENLEQRLAGASGGGQISEIPATETGTSGQEAASPMPETRQGQTAKPKPDQFDAGQALWSAIWARIVNAFKRLFGKK
jgi:uncharacterized protein